MENARTFQLWTFHDKIQPLSLVLQPYVFISARAAATASTRKQAGPSSQTSLKPNFTASEARLQHVKLQG